MGALQARISVVRFPEGTPVRFHAEGCAPASRLTGIQSYTYVMEEGTLFGKIFYLGQTLRFVFLFPHRPISSPNRSKSFYSGMLGADLVRTFHILMEPVQAVVETLM
jgi:hypothetical protein